MKVVHLISSEGFYGAENMLVSLASAQRRQGWQSVVAAFQHNRCEHVAVCAAARSAQLDSALVRCRGRWDTTVPGQIRLLLASSGATVLHTHGYKADVYGWLAARGTSVALVSTCHNWPDPNWLMRAYAKLDRRVLRRFDHVTTPSAAVASLLRSAGVAAERVSIIPNGIEVERFRAAAATLCLGSPLLGFVGRLVEAKGGRILLEAAREVLQVHPDAHLVLVGEGPAHQAWQHLADTLGIGGRVTFAGARCDMAGVYASLDLLVLPSLDEAMPMCLLEGLSAGCAAVATRVGDVPRVILPESTGLLVEPGDSTGLAAAILRLLDDQPLARRLAAAGRELVEKQFSAGAMAAEYSRIYTRIEGARRAA